MLEFIISSALRRKVLIYLLNNQEKEFHLRELSRNVGEPASVVKRELDRFDQIGFVLSWKAGNRRYFRVNRNFLLLDELKSLVDKSTSVSNPIRVAKTFVLRETVEKRKSWEMKSREISREYGNNVKRRKPRHPTETRLLEKKS
jgi:predicted transcriptional regulator with HTH domain